MHANQDTENGPYGAAETTVLLALCADASSIECAACFVLQETRHACVHTCGSCIQFGISGPANRVSHIFEVIASLDRWHETQTKIESSPKHKEKKEEYEHNQQSQVWYNLGLQVLLVVWCAISCFKLNLSSRGHSGIKTAGLQTCSTSS